jgi:hypothetical protein
LGNLRLREVNNFLKKAQLIKRRNQDTKLREGVGKGGRNDPNIVCTYE